MRSLFQILALSILSLPLVVSGAPAPESEPQLVKRASPQGIDVSFLQGPINWNELKSQGVQFAYIQATDGTTFIDPFFQDNLNDAAVAHIIRGAYHSARPAASSGAAQAQYFMTYGTGWSPNGISLPGAIYLEGSCSGLSTSAMVTWIQDFSNTYHGATGRFPVIYTTTSWWTECTGNSGAFGTTNPLWIANWAGSIGPLPAGWSSPTFWQYAKSGLPSKGQDYFIGDTAGLQRFASG